MEGLTEEVSVKIRSAIRAKLMELGAYVDDELPDYIMVLVANKKTSDQMREDLGLFLHQHAETFTVWLQEILNKLKQVTKGKVAVKSADSKEKKEVKKKTKKHKASPERKAGAKSSDSRKRSPPSHKNDHHRDRGRLASSIGAVVSHDSDGEYDPEQMLKRSLVASQVNVARPTVSRDNKGQSHTLLFKAVADADKSLARQRTMNRRRDTELDEIHHRRMKLTMEARKRKNSSNELPVAAAEAVKSRKRSRSEQHEDTHGRLKSHVEEDKRRMNLEAKEDRKQARVRLLEEKKRAHEERKRLRVEAEQAKKMKKVEAHKEKKRLRLEKEAVRQRRVSKEAIELRSDSTADLRQRLEKRKLKKPPSASDLDEDEELLRQRVLESMKRKKQEDEEDEAKIIIPLNEESSEEDEQLVKAASETTLSSSPPPKQEDIEGAPANPQFIVTLDGISSSYFRSKSEEKTAPLEAVPTTKHRPAAMVAPMRKEESAPAKKERKRITPPPPVKAAASQKGREQRTPPKRERSNQSIVRRERKRITPPETSAVKATSNEPLKVSVCRYWPNCTRGAKCFFSHPPVKKDKFRWTPGNSMVM